MEKILQAWLLAEIERKSPSLVLKNKGIKNIAIYGMGILGYLFFKDAMQNNLNVSCIIDKEEKQWGENIKWCSLEDINSTEVIVICSSNYSIEIYEQILEKYENKYDIFFLDDLVYESLL